VGSGESVAEAVKELGVRKELCSWTKAAVLGSAW